MSVRSSRSSIAVPNRRSRSIAALSTRRSPKMASRLRLFGGQLRTFWEEQPVIFISIAMGISGTVYGAIANTLKYALNGSNHK